jgi:ABC-type branched-subunit amino acid transport system ATPase component/ABC-type branched-subunit amino acid transport system permease subunit
MTIGSLTFNATFLNLVIINALYAYSAYFALMGGGFVLLFAGFIGVGAYAASIAVTREGYPLAAAIVLGAVICAAVAALLARPLYRISGIYLGIVSLTLVEFLQTAEVAWKSVTLGSVGVSLPSTDLVGTSTLLIIGVCVVAITALISRSSLGRLIRARREDTILTAAVGVDVRRMWIGLIIVSAALAGLAGGVSASWYGYVSPTTYSFSLIVTTVAMVMLGGSRHWLGPLVGAALLTALTQGFQGLDVWSSVAVGAVLLVIVLLAPAGIIGTVRREVIRRRARRRGGPAGSGESVGHDAQAPGQHDEAGPAGKADEAPAAPAGGPLDASADTATWPLSCDSISWRVAGLQILDGVSLSVAVGEICGLVGPNGSGKSSLINVLAGVTRPDRGYVRVCGADLTGQAAHRFARAGLARTFQAVRLLEDETVVSNIVVGAWRNRRLVRAGTARLRFRGRDRGRAALELRQAALRLLELSGDSRISNLLASDVPHGTRRMVEFARAVIAAPSVLLLDEPTSGVSMDRVAIMKTMARAQARRGCAVLIVDHDLDVIKDVCDRVVVLDAGRKIYDGPVGGAFSDPLVREAFIGS